MKYFRWTPRTAWITFAYAVAVPAMFGYMGFVTDVSASDMKSGGVVRENADGKGGVGEVGDAGKAEGGYNCGILEDYTREHYWRLGDSSSCIYEAVVDKDDLWFANRRFHYRREV